MTLTITDLRNLIEEVIEELSGELTEKRKRKEQCGVGNPNHLPPNSGKESGRFSKRSKAGSWSLQWASKEKDCAGKKSGVAKMRGGKELFTKIPCGREDKEGGKSPNKCGGENS